MTIKEKILNAQADDQQLLECLEQFAPLLRKYARKLTSEDAYADLQLKLIQFILQFNPDKMRSSAEPYILSYLNRCIYNYYIYLSKQECLERMISPISSMGNADEDYTSDDILDRLCPPSPESYTHEEFDLLYRTLTVREAEIIIAIYYFGYTTREVASHYGVSAPAICQSKSNAIKKLKKAITQEGQH